MDYKTVYEVSSQGMKFFWLVPVLFVVLGAGSAWFNIKFNKSKSFRRSFSIVFGFIFSGIALLFTLLIAPFEIGEYFETKSMYKEGRYKIVEGKIENFVPMPYGGHMHESFTVNGLKFEYSDFDETYYGFNNTASHGGPLKANGQQVRLSYITNEDDRNIILKIELKQ